MKFRICKKSKGKFKKRKEGLEKIFSANMRIRKLIFSETFSSHPVPLWVLIFGAIMTVTGVLMITLWGPEAWGIAITVIGALSALMGFVTASLDMRETERNLRDIRALYLYIHMKSNGKDDKCWMNTILFEQANSKGKKYGYSVEYFLKYLNEYGEGSEEKENGKD